MAITRFTYQDGTNETTDSQNLVARDEAAGAASGRDIYVKQILWGDPDNGDVTILHDAITQPGHASGMGSVTLGEAAFKLTQPSAGNGLNLAKELTFAGKGLRLDGGSFHTDCEEVTIIWEIAEDSDYNFTYINAANSTTDSTNLETRDEATGAGAGKDTYVKQIIFGDPDDSDITILHDAQTQPGHASGMDSIAVGEAAWKFEQPAAGAGLHLAKEITFPGKGLRLNGGSIHTDCSEVTVIWTREE